jgi:hypothetical protein
MRRSAGSVRGGTAVYVIMVIPENLKAMIYADRRAEQIFVATR